MTTITTATIQSMLARNARDICAFELINQIQLWAIKKFKADIDKEVVKYIQVEVAKRKKQIKLLAAIQRQLKDEIRERKAYHSMAKSFWEARRK